MSPRLRVGTSGWAYRHWDRFYPRAVKAPRFLAFYSRRFPTVEVNTSFYHLPRPETYLKWAAETDADFLFALKLSRYITHIKKLAGVKVATRRFLSGAAGLGPKLGPVLVQLPPAFRAEPKRLGRFLETVRAVADPLELRPLRLAFEFRHDSWFDSAAVRDVLTEHAAAIVFGHSSRYPYPAAEPRTAPWVYLRFHGPRELFASAYGREGLRPWARKVSAWMEGGADVYAYFNNDAGGHAVEDARLLNELVLGAG